MATTFFWSRHESPKTSKSYLMDRGRWKTRHRFMFILVSSFSVSECSTLFTSCFQISVVFFHSFFLCLLICSVYFSHYKLKKKTFFHPNFTIRHPVLLLQDALCSASSQQLLTWHSYFVGKITSHHSYTMQKKCLHKYPGNEIS